MNTTINIYLRREQLNIVLLFLLCDFQSVSLRLLRDKKTTRYVGARRRLYPKNSKRDTIKVFKPIVKRKEKNMAQKAHSLSHTKWHCKYHIVFTPKYRRKVIYNQYRSSLGEIFHRLCSYKGVEIIEGHLMPDHVHMLVSIPPRISISSFMGYLYLTKTKN